MSGPPVVSIVSVQRRKRVTIERFFLTHQWHRKGVVEADGYADEHGYASNYGIPGMKWSDHFGGKIGSSVFRDRADAVEAVKKKAAAKARELRRRAEKMERIAEHGPDAVAAADATKVKP